VVPTPRRTTAAAFPTEVFAKRCVSVALLIPTLDEAETVGATVSAGVRLRDQGVLDEVVVVDGGSADSTVDEARAAGARVVDADGIYPETGPVLGKGDTLWRGLGAMDVDVVAFLDADLQGDVEAMIRGLLGPMVVDPEAVPGLNGGAPPVEFVKGAFRRIAPDGASPSDPFDGGRVTEMVVRPLLNLWRPDLAGFYQPLSGQVAGRTGLLRSLPMLTGYALEIGMLLDVVEAVGFRSVVEVDLGTVRNRPRPTGELAPMAQEVLYGFARRVLPTAARPRWRPYARPARPGETSLDQMEMELLPSTVVERPPIDPFSDRREPAGGSVQERLRS
jgi:glucosyl-3-phosphoglycerate synthase